MKTNQHLFRYYQGRFIIKASTRSPWQGMLSTVGRTCMFPRKARKHRFVRPTAKGKTIDEAAV